MPCQTQTSTQLVRCFLNIEDSPSLLAPHSIILQHPAVDSCILTFELQHRLCGDSFKDEVIIAMWTIFIALFELGSVFAESFLALFADEGLGGRVSE